MEVADALSKATVKVVQKNQDTPTTQTSDVSDSVGLGNSLMMAFFKLNPNETDKKTLQKLNQIYDYARDQTGDDEELGIVQTLRNIRFRLGEPKGLSEVDHIYNYITLKKEAKKLQAEAQALEE
jgi:hypothetical protein